QGRTDCAKGRHRVRRPAARSACGGPLRKELTRVTEVRFYHLQRSTLESVLPRMLERVVERGQRAVVMVGSPERVEALTAYLWTYDDRGFLPHGNARDGMAERQPIWLTDSDENPNRAVVLFQSDGAESGRIAEFE